jgi:hypothetical protein
VGSVGNSAIRNGWCGTRAQGAIIHDKRRDHNTALAPENPRDQPGIHSRLYGADEEHIVGLTVARNYFSCHLSNGMNRLADGDEDIVLLAALKIR